MKGKASIPMVVIAAVVVMLLLGFSRYKAQVYANLWHWRHGYSLSLVGYEIPVPSNWLVFTQDDNGASLVNVRTVKLRVPATIIVLSGNGPVNDLEVVEQAQQKVLEEHGARNIAAQRLTSNNEQILCISSIRPLVKVTGLETKSVDCRFKSGLTVGYWGPDSATAKDPQSAEFYAIVAGVRKIR